MWFYSPSDDQFHRTGLRHVLDRHAAPPVTRAARPGVLRWSLDPARPEHRVRRHRHRGLAGHRTSNDGAHTGRRSSTGCRRPPCRTCTPGSTRRRAAAVAAAAARRRAVARRVGGRPGGRRRAAPPGSGRSRSGRPPQLPLAAALDPFAPPPAPPAVVHREPRHRRAAPVAAGGAPTFLGGAKITALTPRRTRCGRSRRPSAGCTRVSRPPASSPTPSVSLVALHRATMTPAKTAGRRRSTRGVDRRRRRGARQGRRHGHDRHGRPARRLPCALAHPGGADRRRRPRSTCSSWSSRAAWSAIWTVFREPSTVDVLVHHRDARAGRRAGLRRPPVAVRADSRRR